MLFEKTSGDPNGKKATITHSKNKKIKANGYTGTDGFTKQINEILEKKDNLDAINATVFNTTSTISDTIHAEIPKGVFEIKTNVKNELPPLEDNINETEEMKNNLKNSVFNFGIKGKKKTGGAPIYTGGALPLPIKIPKPKKMKGGDAEFQTLVDTLEQKINEIVSHPILVKIKSLKADSVRELCKRTVIYKDMNRDSFFLTKDIMDIVMDFLFVDYTTLDVFKQIYYYYQSKMDADKDSSGNEIPNNIIRQQIYTHSGIMKIINVLLNKFTYEQYYPDFVKTPDANPKQSLLEKDTEYHREVHGKYNDIEVGMNFGDDHVKYTGPTQSESEDDGGKGIEFEEDTTEGGQRGGQGEATALAIALAIQSTTPPPVADAEDAKNTDTEEQNKEKAELQKILPKHRKYIYISRFMKLIEAFREINPKQIPETPPKDVNSLHVQKMLEMMIYNHLRSYNMVKQVLGLMINDYNTEFFEVLNYLVRLQNSKLISYLKINNYENPMRLGTELANYDHENIQTDSKFIIDYNRRYNVFVNNPNITENWRNTYFSMPPPPATDSAGRKLKTDEVRTGLKTMALQYNDDDFPYYEKKNDTFYASEAVIAADDDKKPRGFTVEATTDGDKVVADSKTDGDEIDKSNNESNNDSKNGLNDGGDDYSDDNDFENDSDIDGGADIKSQPKYKGGANYKTLSKVAQYDKTYLFGRMNQIFLPHYSNEEVAQNMESIIDLITNKVGQKKLFTIGYGASGAGKTSSLIYLNKGALENREGIIIHLCNRLAAMGYKSAEIKTKEFFSSPKNPAFETAMEKFSTEDKENKQRISYTQKPYADNANKNNPAAATADNLVLYTVERGPFYFKHTMNNLTQKEEFLCFKDAGYGEIIGNNGSTSSPVAEEKSPVNETELSIALSAALNMVDAKGGDSELQFGGDEHKIEVAQKTSDLFGNVHTYRTFEEYNIDGTDGIKKAVVRFPHPQFNEEKQTQDPNMLVNLGKLLIYLIDTDRLVKATTNNPNSSRSHVLLFLKLTLGTGVEKLAQNVDIVIGDFAGVENAFGCDAVSVSNFLAIQKDVVPRTLYYKYDATKEVEKGTDVIHGGGDGEDEVKKENNKFAEDIYSVLNGLRGDLYKIDTGDSKSTTTEFEVIGNDNMLKEGDIMDYLLTYEGQSLMKVLSPNKDYTKLQKSLEWVGRYKKDYFDDRIKKYEGNLLKITEHEDNLAQFISSGTRDVEKFNTIIQSSDLDGLIEIYNNVNMDDKTFNEQLTNIDKSKITETANKEIENLGTNRNIVKQQKIDDLNRCAIYLKTMVTPKYQKSINKDTTTKIFEEINSFLNKKKTEIDNQLSGLSDIIDIKKSLTEIKYLIETNKKLIDNYLKLYKKVDERYKYNEPEINQILDKDDSVILTKLIENNISNISVNDNDNNSFKIKNEQQYNNNTYSNLIENKIGLIKSIEDDIENIKTFKMNMNDFLEKQNTNIKNLNTVLTNSIQNTEKTNEEISEDINNYKFDNTILGNINMDKQNKINNAIYNKIIKNIDYFDNKLNDDIRIKFLESLTDKYDIQKLQYDDKVKEANQLKIITKIDKKIDDFLNKKNALQEKIKELNFQIDHNYAEDNDNIVNLQTKQSELKDKIKEIKNLELEKQTLENTKSEITREINDSELENKQSLIDKINPQEKHIAQLITEDTVNKNIIQIQENIKKIKQAEQEKANKKKEEDINKLITDYKESLNDITNIKQLNSIESPIQTDKLLRPIYEEKQGELTKKFYKEIEKIKNNKNAEIKALNTISSENDTSELDKYIGFWLKDNIKIENLRNNFNIDEEFKTLILPTLTINTSNDKLDDTEISTTSNLIYISNKYFKKNNSTTTAANYLCYLLTNKLYDSEQKIKFTDCNNLTFNTGASGGVGNYISAINKYNIFIKDTLKPHVEKLLEKYKEKQKNITSNQKTIQTNLKNIYDEIVKKPELNYDIAQIKEVFEEILGNEKYNNFKTYIDNTIPVNYVQRQNYGGNPPQKGGDIASLNARYQQNIQAIQEIKAQVELLYKYYQYGQKVCENRKKEGVFINQSLEEVRKTIQEILIFNADGSIETTPDFIEDCLKLYCPSGKDCFQMNQSAAKDAKIPSELFDAIFQHYKAQYETKDLPTPPEELKKKFYNELIVNIFCVFNITKSANNPPVVPYIDINALKRLYFNRNSIKLSEKRNQNDTKLFTEIQKVLLNIAKYPKKLKELHDSKDIQLLAKQFLPTTITFPFPSQANATDNTKTPFSMDLTKTQYDKLFPNPPTTTAPTTAKITDVLKNNIRGMIELVDRTNAASVIGTLEFVDIMSKFGTTNNICSVNDLELPGIDTEEKKFAQMKKVLQLHEISNYDFLNPPDAEQPQPVDFFQLLSDHYKYEQGTNTWDKPDKKGGATANKHSKRNKTAKRPMGRRKNQTEKNI